MVKPPRPVVWRPRRRCTHPALAVPCGACGAYQGAPCRQTYASGPLLAEPHASRAEIAEELGFAWAAGAEPPPASDPDSAETDERQQSLFTD